MCDKVVFGVFFSCILVAGCTRENPLFAIGDGGTTTDAAVATSHGPGPSPDGDEDMAGAFHVVDASVAPHPDMGLVCTTGAVDCDGDPSNGCETIASAEPGEPGNASCGGATMLTAIAEGDHGSASGRILVPGDLDVFVVELDEGLHACNDGDTLDFTVRATLAAPSGVSLNLRGALDPDQCSTSWSAWAADTVCFHFSDSCSFAASQVVSLQVGSLAGASSCEPYAVDVQFCNAGDDCGC